MLIAQQTKLEAVRKVKQQLADEYKLQNNTRERMAAQVVCAAAECAQLTGCCRLPSFISSVRL